MPYRPTPKTEAKKAAMRERLMAAARNLFVTQGYEETSLQQIVKAADTSIGNCYFYFPNKEALLVSIAEEFRTELAAAIDRAVEPLPLGPNLLAVAIYTGAIAALAQPELTRLTLSATVHPALRPLTTELFAARVQRAFEAMPQLFTHWPEATPAMAAIAWHGSSSYILEGAVTGRIPEEPARVALFLTRWNLQALGFSEEAIRQGMESLPALTTAPKAEEE